jgi:serine/threonine protein kinase
VRMRIVAADDDTGMRRVLDRCLRAWGYEPVLCENGQEAWKLLKRDDCPRVVILDWDMPGLSGLEVCRLLRSTPHGKDLYVLMLTARQEKADIVAALESGADDFLAKPFHSRELQLRLAKGVRDASRNTANNSSAGADRTVPPTGTTLAGKYRLEKKIASGGMGSVWLGVHLSLGVNIAIKFMDRALAETAAYASFEREARAAAQLRNEHIVRIYDHGVDQQGLPYLVMEYLGGDSLSQRIDEKGPLLPSDVVLLVEQVARALTEAHARGVVHRDIKPDNILLVEDADRERTFTVKLIDFGLADPESTRRDKPGEIAGTPQYMSPEYISASAHADAFLDLWALAVTAFVAMTGATPFDGNDLDAVYHRILSTPPVPSQINAAVPRGFDAWFERACASERSARFQSGAEMASALAAACRSPLGMAAERPSPVPGVARDAASAALFAPTETDARPPGSSAARSPSG